MRGERRGTRAGTAGGAALVLLALGGFAWWAWLLPAMALEAPRAGERIGIGGLELLVRFDGRVEPSTVRVLLNGADVTAACVTASNGVHGRLHGLLDGENRVRVEAFARARWPAGLLVAQAREVRVWFRPPTGFDRG